MDAELKSILKLSKNAGKALYIIGNTGCETSTTQVQAYLSCTRAKALAAIKELANEGLIDVFNDINGTYGDGTRGYKLTSRL